MNTKTKDLGDHFALPTATPSTRDFSQVFFSPRAIHGVSKKLKNARHMRLIWMLTKLQYMSKILFVLVLFLNLERSIWEEIRILKGDLAPLHLVERYSCFYKILLQIYKFLALARLFCKCKIKRKKARKQEIWSFATKSCKSKNIFPLNVRACLYWNVWVASDVTWNIFDVSHWLTEKRKEGTPMGSIKNVQMTCDHVSRELWKWLVEIDVFALYMLELSQS